jgi:hypothetical protein
LMSFKLPDFLRSVKRKNLSWQWFVDTKITITI